MTPSRNLTARAFRAAVPLVRIHLPPAESPTNPRGTTPRQRGQPLPTLIIAGFGVVLSTYMLHVIDDGSGHIESNWRRSDLVLGKEHIHEITRDRRARRQNHAFAWLMSYVAQSVRLVHSIVVLIAFLVLYEKWSGFSFSSIK